MEFFQAYFDVTTDEIKDRFISSLLPFNKRFFALYKDKPDLYGPFWIYTTLVVILAITSNFQHYLESSDEFAYDFRFVPIAALVVYSKPQNPKTPSIVRKC